MPFDLAAGPPRPRPTLREGTLELMLRAQSGPGLDESAARAELRRLVAATRDPAAELWAVYAGGREARRRCHAALTLG